VVTRHDTPGGSKSRSQPTRHRLNPQVLPRDVHDGVDHESTMFQVLGAAFMSQSFDDVLQAL
jgi:hypothetical protein